MPKIPIALQLYSIRHECEKDLPGCLEAVANMGYDGVEFAGYYGRTARELRQMLDDNGLKCAGTHIGLDTVLGDALQETIEFNRTIGNRFLIVPGLSNERTCSRAAWLETAKLFNEASEHAMSFSMRVGYHNHDTEFHELDGEMPLDTLFGNTNPRVSMQLDIGNAMIGGGDPLPFITRYAGRSATAHVKEFKKGDPTALIGEGDVNWPEVFCLFETHGATEWYIVEYEVDPMPALESVDKCLKNLRAMGK